MLINVKMPTIVGTIFQFQFFTIFGLKNVKKTFLKNLSVFSAVSFYGIEVQVITNPSSRLEKHQTLYYLLMTDFL